MHHWQFRRLTSLVSLLVMVTLVCLLLLATPRPAHAAYIYVNSTADNGPGNCATICTLRDAIASAWPGDRVSLSVTGMITLIGGTLTIAKDLSIMGPGPSSLA